MSLLLQEYAASQDTTFIQRCHMGMIAFCLNVIETEGVNTPNHTNRAIFARSVVANPTQWAPALAQGVIALNAVADGSTLTDQQVNDGIAAIWNMYAGVV
jgi:hypothetical protein